MKWQASPCFSLRVFVSSLFNGGIQVGWSGQPCKAHFWDWKLGPSKVHYLLWLTAFEGPHIARCLERFWRYVPENATVGLVGGLRDNGATGTQEESAVFRRNTRALRVLCDSGPAKRKGRSLPHHSPRYTTAARTDLNGHWSKGSDLSAADASQPFRPASIRGSRAANDPARLCAGSYWRWTRTR